jgi:hypothetical protein
VRAWRPDETRPFASPKLRQPLSYERDELGRDVEGLARDGEHLGLVPRAMRDDHQRRGSVVLDVELDTTEPLIRDVESDRAMRGHEDAPVGHAQLSGGRREAQLDALAGLEQAKECSRACQSGYRGDTDRRRKAASGTNAIDSPDVGPMSPTRGAGVASQSHGSRRPRGGAGAIASSSRSPAPCSHPGSLMPSIRSLARDARPVVLALALLTAVGCSLESSAIGVRQRCWPEDERRAASLWRGILRIDAAGGRLEAPEGDVIPLRSGDLRTRVGEGGGELVRGEEVVARSGDDVTLFGGAGSDGLLVVCAVEELH